MKTFQPNHVANALNKTCRGLVASYRIPTDIPAKLSLVPLESGDLVAMLLVGDQAIQIPLDGDSSGGSLFVFFMTHALGEHEQIDGLATRLRRGAGQVTVPSARTDAPLTVIDGGVE